MRQAILMQELIREEVIPVMVAIPIILVHVNPREVIIQIIRILTHPGLPEHTATTLTVHHREVSRTIRLLQEVRKHIRRLQEVTTMITVRLREVITRTVRLQDLTALQVTALLAAEVAAAVLLHEVHVDKSGMIFID